MFVISLVDIYCMHKYLVSVLDVMIETCKFFCSCILTGRQKAMSADMNTGETMSALRKTESRDSIDLIGE